MTQTLNTIDVYVESGRKKTFAGAIGWPGWGRMGRNEESALQALFDYGPRYAQVLRPAQIKFQTPTNASTLVVIERHEGNATTDFGGPAITPSRDLQPVDETEFERSQTLLKACWQAFDATVQQAFGRELRKGPRGGGRDLDKIVQHVLDADATYLPRLAWKFRKGQGDSQSEELYRTRQAILDALSTTVHDELPERGPRGGVIWKPRYFVRRVAWHTLDHLWEIEDRVM